MARVFVGMSGGVDSSVTAALLVDQGHEVTGVYMKNWSQDMPGLRCPWAEDVADAKRVAVGLGIDFQVFDFEKEYKQQVVDAMVDEYRSGRTPNPDVMCNQEIKFKLFLEASLEKGAEMIATGHYAQTRDGKLLKAVDSEKDQTYFLYRVTKEALERTLFPLGGLTKLEVRQIAGAKGLWTADKPESMGICFVGQVGIKDFLSQYLDFIPGDIIDYDTGKKLGEHEGAVIYTTGQRHGLNIGGGLPYYVVDKDVSKNIVFASRDLNSPKIWRDRFLLTQVHWIDSKPTPKTTSNLQVRLRHRGELLAVKTFKEVADGVEITLDTPQRAVAIGQSAVVYHGGEVLGGGIIAKTD